MTDLIDTTEMYLRTIWELQEEGTTPLRARIAGRLGHSVPTVSQTIARMQRDGLVQPSDGRELVLTDAGHLRALRVMRKHRLAECLLAQMIGLPTEMIHEEACRWEHVMSQEVEQRLVTLLGQPHTSPFGHPIPGLDELGLPPLPQAEQPPQVSLAQVLEQGRAGTWRLVRISEHAQSMQILLALAEVGLVLGASVELTHEGRLAVQGRPAPAVLPPESPQALWLISDPGGEVDTAWVSAHPPAGGQSVVSKQD